MARRDFTWSVEAISKIALVLIVVIILVVALLSGIYVFTTSTQSQNTSSTSTSTSSSSTISSAQSTSSPQVLTWETPSTIDYLDPHVSYTVFSYAILQNVYEPLLWYNGSCSSCIIPWLAKNFTASPDLRAYNFTLRSGITFADGEPLNSTAVYFSLNRLLIEDGSTPVSHGTQASFILQQLLNQSLSTALCCSQTYDSDYVKQVLGENFIEITGLLTFTFHIQNPSFALQFMLGDIGSDIVAPNYVMKNDLAKWSQSSNGYHLPYASLSENETTRIYEYFVDEVSTCNNGSTPGGCGTTSLDSPSTKSLAGTGPYLIQSFDSSANDIVLQANPDYWGGPQQFSGGIKAIPRIATIKINYVPDQPTRILDLTNAAHSGQAMTVDVEPDHIYDVANRTAWLADHNLTPIIPGVSLYGPYNSFYTYFAPFAMNVTNMLTGEFYEFQPFADLRFRLAFADSVNMTAINLSVNNQLGKVALNVVPPGLPPQGAYNTSIGPLYGYNLTTVEKLLLDAMLHPLTKLNFVNGTLAPADLFNNTFGCTTLGTDNRCINPVPRTITLTFYTGDTVDQAIFLQIAGVINNLSSTYNMGLTVSVTPIPFGQMSTEAFSDELYLYMIGGWGDDFPYVMDFLGPMFDPGQVYPVSDGWNFTAFGQLYREALNASAAGDNAGVIRASNAINELANREVMYLWTFNPLTFMVITSNVQGFYFNPSLIQEPSGFYFATMY